MHYPNIKLFRIVLWLIALTAFRPSANADNVVVIDPGHGGRDVAGEPQGEAGSGSSYNNATSATMGLLEKDLTLEYAKEILAAFADSPRAHRLHIQPLLTRENDNLGAMQRAAFAAEHRATIFLSIHFNTSSDHKASGTRVYYVPQDHPHWEYMHFTNAYEKRDKAFCSLIAKHVAEALTSFSGNTAHADIRPDSDDRKDGIRVLGFARQDTYMWNCAIGLMEVEFIDNPSVEGWLLGKDRISARKAVAQAVVDGTCDFLESSAQHAVAGPLKAPGR